ncbi:unnamed protein product [Rotaria sp. Silwood1]|nr:unnamed protein product [Rotaria sp. Silwood1]
MVVLSLCLRSTVRIVSSMEVLKTIQSMVCRYDSESFYFRVDFCILAWTTDPSERVMITFATTSVSQVQLPAGNDSTWLLNLVAYIRDKFDYVTEFVMPSVIVVPDLVHTDTFVADLQNYSGMLLSKNPFMEMLNSGNLNAIEQVITSLSQILNKNHSRIINIAVENEHEIPIKLSKDHPIEFIIPRDINMVMPPMSWQNVTLINNNRHDSPFNLHLINMTHSQSNTNLTVSLHIEISPANTNISYMFIYKFDSASRLDSIVEQIDGWTLFCQSS